MEKILTIVVPTYNMEKYLDKCLTSLIIEDKELLNRLEVLVIIDGATDRSSEIAHTYQDSYPDTFRVIDKENGNYGSCINRGLKEATGKYIKILDADDYFDTIVFESYIRKIEDVDVDLVLNDMHSFTLEGEDQILYNIASFFDDNTIHGFDELFAIDIPRYVAMHCIAYKTNNVRSIDYKQTEGISYTDVEWCVIPMRTVKTFLSIKGFLYMYLMGRNGQTTSPNVLKKSLPQLSKMLYVVVQSMDDYNNHDDVYYAFMKKMMIPHIYNLYRNMRYSEILNETIRPFDDSINNMFHKTYLEMQNWSVNACGINIRYIAIINHPWKELFRSVAVGGHTTFIAMLDFLYTVDLLKPRWVLLFMHSLKDIVVRIKQ